jgi:hypothetical protein
MRRLALCCVLVGCGANLADDPGQQPTVIDAPQSRTPDASSIAIDAPTDAPACFNGRVVFLNFGGATLTQAATDSTQDRAAWIGVATATLPAYKAGNANRMGLINNIVTGVQSALAQYPISVVTTRPMTGQYVMIVFGGANTDVGSNYTYATGDHDCGDAIKNDVGWVSDQTPNNIAVPVALGTIGWVLGLQGTTDPTDCMCGWANSCQWSGSTCSLHAGIATTASSAPASTCTTNGTQDELAAFSTAFCQ